VALAMQQQRRGKPGDAAPSDSDVEAAAQSAIAW
jgi:hypothetical protein